MPNIGLFIANYHSIDTNAICLSFNRVQTYYKTARATKIENQGSPDLPGYRYSDKSFVQLVENYLNKYDYITILTAVPIEQNFFTRDINCKIIVITTHEAEEIIAKSGRSFEKYFIIGLCAELVSIEFQKVTGKNWDDLYHPDPRACLFDFAGIKEQAIARLKKCDICDPCRGKITNANIDEKIIKAIDAVLRSIRRPSFLKSISHCFQKPVLSFIYGGIVVSTLVNFLTSFLFDNTPVTPKQLAFICLMVFNVFAFPLLVYAWDWISYWRQRLE